MIKFVVLALLVAFFTSVPNNSAMAACTCKIGYYCCNNATGCCAPSAADCQAVCGTSVIPCPDECQSTITWSNTTNNRQARCIYATGTCEYRCKANYYNTGTTTNVTCATCPAYATCPVGSGLNDGEYLPVCSRGRYGHLQYIIFQGNTYSCPACPSIETADGATVTGTTASTGATDITECYLQPGFSYRNETGTFTVTSNCYYKEGTTSGGVPVVPAG